MIVPDFGVFNRECFNQNNWLGNPGSVYRVDEEEFLYRQLTFKEWDGKRGQCKGVTNRLGLTFWTGENFKT